MILALVKCILKYLPHNLIDLIFGNIHTTMFDSVISVMIQLLNGQMVESSLAACSYILPAVLTNLLSHE